MINKIKENKKLKAALFFGFYFFFFLYLVNITNSRNYINQISTENHENEKEIVKDYSIEYLKNNNYKYHFVINEKDKVLEFNGTNDMIDYDEYENKYFLNIYNINQIIKNGKYIKTDDNILNYEVDNSVISDLLGDELHEGISEIMVYVNKDKNLEKVIIDLSNYMSEKYVITLNYEVGDIGDQNYFS